MNHIFKLAPDQIKKFEDWQKVIKEKHGEKMVYKSKSFKSVNDL